MQDVMKKRIVGAIVLVIIGVLIPLLLARCLGGDDAGSQSMRVYEITPDGQAEPAGGGQAARPETETRPATGDDTDEAPADRPQRPALPEAVSPDHVAGADDDDETPAAAEPPATATPEPEPAAETASDDDSGSASRRREAGGGGWVVQIASFTREDNAQRMADELGGDYDTFYSAGDVNGTTYYRVKVGPFDSESEARSAASRLEAAGRSTLVQRNR